mmetsp:Transcript_6062/g.6933  ORF Transcript_6062/g.6933 Transcript_6062/m.6933 type:complete len:648 (-) Transcript_6062:66-2009(-)
MAFCRRSTQFAVIFNNKHVLLRTQILLSRTTSATAIPTTVPYSRSTSRKWLSSSTKQNNSNRYESFTVSILGPPNSGKSTLFNRLQCKERNRAYKLGSRRKAERGGKDGIKGRIASKHTSKGNAIVSPIAGTTRDRRECWGRIGSSEFQLIDTAGIDGDRLHALSSSNRSKSEKNALERGMMEQTLEAAKKSDLVMLLWDARVGMSQDLLITARWLRKLGKLSNVALIANKLEGDSWAHDEDSFVMENLRDVLRLGLGNAIPISALQGDGLADIAILIEKLKVEKEAVHYEENIDDIIKKESWERNSEDQKPLQIAIIGRQNVGKSTLVNRLLKNDRVLTGRTPGLTRDAIAVEFNFDNLGDNHLVQLVDTAGIRKLTKRIGDSIEDQSVADALRAMQVAEVAVLVLDAKELYIQRQELAICNAVLNEGRALVIAANKMDLIEMSSEYTPRDFATSVREQIESRIPMLRNIPIVPMSCISGKGVSKVLPTVLDARNRWARTISTGLLNRWLGEVVTGTQPPFVEGVRAKLKYIIQTKGRPPTFIIFSNVKSLPESYLKYLTHQFQDSFELFGMPVRLVVKTSAKVNPYDSKKKKRSGFGLGGKKARFQRRIEKWKVNHKKNKNRTIHTNSCSHEIRFDSYQYDSSEN